MIDLGTWAPGYCAARGYAQPHPGPAGLWLEVGLPDQRGRHLMTGAFDPQAYRRLVAEVTEPFVYVEALAPREDVLPLTPARWTVLDPAWLMAVRLAEAHVAPPPGYTVRVIEEAAKLQVEIDGPDGSPAATGRCGLAGDAATFDRIVTEEAHRRRGLGKVVMVHLATAALARGVTHGVLIATADGRALYRALGWDEVGEVTYVISA